MWDEPSITSCAVVVSSSATRRSSRKRKRSSCTARARASSRAQNCSNSRFKTNDSGSSVSTGDSNSMASSKWVAGSHKARVRMPAPRARRCKRVPASPSREASACSGSSARVRKSRTPHRSSVSSICSPSFWRSRSEAEPFCRRDIECIQQHLQGQHSQAMCLLSGGEHSSPTESPRGMQGSFRIGRPVRCWPPAQSRLPATPTHVPWMQAHHRVVPARPSRAATCRWRYLPRAA